jgi:hypothetical protein
MKDSISDMLQKLIGLDISLNILERQLAKLNSILVLSPKVPHFPFLFHPRAM